MLRIAVAASGNGSNFENLVQKSQTGQMPQTEIVCLIVDKENAYAIERAKKYNIPTFILHPKSYVNKECYERAIIQILESQHVALLVLAGYMRIVGHTLLTAYPNKIINIHPSYLPAFSGKNGIADAFESGQLESGVSVHFVNETIDGGKMILQEKIYFHANDTFVDWETKIHQLEYDLYPRAIQSLNPYL